MLLSLAYDKFVKHNYCILQLFVLQVITYIRSTDFQSKSVSFMTEKVLPFTEDVTVVLEH